MKSLTMVAVAVLALSASLVSCRGQGAGGAQQRAAAGAGNLEWFELEVAPFMMRFAVVPGHEVMYSKNPQDKEKGKTVLVSRDDPKAASVIKSLDALVKSHRLLESTPNEPEKTFRDETVQTPSVHLRIGYGTDGEGKGQRWQSYYPGDDLPDNVRKFIESCTSLGEDLLREAAGPPPAQE